MHLRLSSALTFPARDFDACLIVGAGAGTYEKGHTGAEVLPWRTIQGGVLECLVAGNGALLAMTPFTL